MLGYTRKKIRTELNNALASIPAVNGRVVSGDPEPFIGLPNITHNIESESLDPSTSSFVYGDDPSGRAIRIIIEGRAEISDGSDAPIDDLCLDIERVIASAATLNSWCDDLRLQNTSYELVESNIPIGLATLEYAGYYIEYPPSAVTLSNVVATPSNRSCVVTFDTNLECKVQVVLFNNGNFCCYSNISPSYTTQHTLTMADLSPVQFYVMYLNIWATAGNGIDVTTDPENPNIDSIFPDGTNSPIFQTTLTA